MNESPFEHDIYFVIKPLHFVSQILGLSPLHIDPEHKCYSERACFRFHVFLTAIMIILLLYGLCKSIVYTTVFSVPKYNAFIHVVWSISILTSYSTSILALLLNVTRNRNHMRNVLSIISLVDSKLLHKHCKQSVYMQQRSHIIRQLMIGFMLYGSATAFSGI
jgi:hypothetical protein